MTDADHEEFRDETEKPYRTVGYSDLVWWDYLSHLYVNGERACCVSRWGRVWFRLTGGHR